MDHDERPAGQLGWVTEFDDPAVTRTLEPKRSLLLAAVGSVVFGGGAIAVIALLIAALTRPVEAEVGVEATRAPVAPPRPTTTATSEGASLVPTFCGALYSEAMHITLTGIGMKLDSTWEGEARAGSADDELHRMLADAELACHWTQTDPAPAALLTRVAELTDVETEAAIARLDALGFTKLTEHDGIRYFVENTAATGPTGESHFFREGIWIATHWQGHGQYGYTADMVRSVFD